MKRPTPDHRLLVFLLASILAFTLMNPPAPARADIELQAATVSLAWELFRDPSPTPYCFTYWDEEFQGGLTIHESWSFAEWPCQSTWLVHSDGDSIRYRVT